MLVTVTESEGRYDLMFGNVEVIGGVQYQVSEEQLKQIQTCDFTQVQSVIRNITLTCKKVGNIINQ